MSTNKTRRMYPSDYVSNRVRNARARYVRRNGFSPFEEDQTADAVSRQIHHARRCAWQATQRTDRRSYCLRSALHHLADARRLLKTMMDKQVDKGARASWIDTDRKAQLRDAIEWAAGFVHDIRTRRIVGAEKVAEAEPATTPSAPSYAPSEDDMGEVALNTRDRDTITRALERGAAGQLGDFWHQPPADVLAAVLVRWRAESLPAGFNPRAPEVTAKNMHDRRWYELRLRVTRRELEFVIAAVGLLRVGKKLDHDAQAYALPRLRRALRLFAARPHLQLVRTAAPNPHEAKRRRAIAPRQLDLFTPDTTPTVYVVACVASKAEPACKAQDLYTSQWFKAARAYVEAKMGPRDTWLIVSAKHGVLLPDQVVAPYDATLNRMSAKQRRAWGDSVSDELSAIFPRYVRVELLAGEHYREALAPWTRNHRTATPLRGLGIGEQLGYFARETRALDQARAAHRVETLAVAA